MHMGMAPFSIRHGSSLWSRVLCGVVSWFRWTFDRSFLFLLHRMEWTTKRKQNQGVEPDPCPRLDGTPGRKTGKGTTDPDHPGFPWKKDGNVIPNPTTILQHRPNNGAATRTNQRLQGDQCSCNWKTETYNESLLRRNPTWRRKPREKNSTLPDHVERKTGANVWIESARKRKPNVAKRLGKRSKVTNVVSVIDPKCIES